MADRRQKNINWWVSDEAGNVISDIRDGVVVAVLMDIRDELQTLNRLLSCQRFIGIPGKLEAIRKNTARPRRAPGKKAAKPNARRKR